MSLFSELNRRNVFRVAAAYLAVAWLLIQIAETLLPPFGFGDTVLKVIVIILAIGFVPTLIVAWVFELTPEGLKLDAEVDHGSASSKKISRRVDRLFFVVLALAITYFAVDKFLLDPARDREELEAAAQQAREEGRIEAAQHERDNSIAVLAFQDQSPDGDQQFLSDGLSEDILNSLANIAQIRVTAKSSAFSFRDGNSTAREIGEALNVAHVLDGSVTRIGDRIRVSVQLVDARSEKQLWSATYDRTFDDIFSIRDEISTKVVASMPIRILADVPSNQRTDAQVYALTLRARAINELGGPRSREARPLLDEALAIDPDYVPALLEKVYNNYHLMQAGAISDEVEYREWTEIIGRILEIDPENGLAHALAAYGKWEVDNNLEAAVAGLGRAVQLSPGNVEVLRLAGNTARRLGLHDESIALLERIESLDPLYLRNFFHLPQSYLWAGRLQDAENGFRRLQNMQGGVTYYLVMTVLLQGDAERALADLDKFAGNDELPMVLGARAMALNDLGRAEEANEALRRLIDKAFDETPYSVYILAQAYAWIGDADSAFEWLDEAHEIDEKYGIDGWWFRFIALLPVWQNLHTDPRWESVMARVGMSAERLAALRMDIGAIK